MFTLEDIHALILAAGSQPIADLEIEKDGWRIRISRSGRAVGPSRAAIEAPSRASAPQSGSGIEEQLSPAAQPEHLILSPGHGVFHRSASPADPAYAEIGQDIEKGKQVGIVEAMKVFSSIISPFSGRIAEILVDSGEDVEAGQPLFRLQ